MSRWLDKKTVFNKEILVENNPIKLPIGPFKKEKEYEDQFAYQPGSTGEEFLSQNHLPSTGFVDQTVRDPNTPTEGFPRRYLDYPSVMGEGSGGSPTGDIKR